ncbi:MAG: maleylpyruvate isomerase family mycothiol-dependent enzyme, partial [Acidimicrobiia bacterium]|nr:maleylpyruvate isomerase family mycothiol-dependent enzyme [Acidimicrobiia bacterium]
MSRGDAYGALLDDLVAEEQSLDDLVNTLDDAGWATPTPAEGWTVRDQVAHLAATEEWATLALTDPDSFRVAVDRLNEDPERRAEETRHGLLARRPPAKTDPLAWWQQGRAAMVEHLRAHGPKDRLPWFGPDMSAMSFATARLMETWAHGVDIADALGINRPGTDRLRHVADLGVRTRGFAYVSRGL